MRIWKIDFLCMVKSENLGMLALTNSRIYHLGLGGPGWVELSSIVGIEVDSIGFI